MKKHIAVTLIVSLLMMVSLFPQISASVYLMNDEEGVSPIEITSGMLAEVKSFFDSAASCTEECDAHESIDEHLAIANEDIEEGYLCDVCFNGDFIREYKVYADLYEKNPVTHFQVIYHYYQCTSATHSVAITFIPCCNNLNHKVW